MITPELILTYMSGPEDGRVVRVTVNGLPPAGTLGRSGDCTVVVAGDPDVSRVHARIYWHEGAWWLEDAGSSNGTFKGEFAQSVKVTGPTKLDFGQIFRFGHTRFRLERPDAQVSCDPHQARAAV